MGNLEWLYLINVLHTAYEPIILYRYYLYFDRYPIKMWNSMLMLICGTTIFIHQILVLLAQLIPELNVWIAAVPLIVADSILTDACILQALIVYFKFQILHVQEHSDTADEEQLDELERILRRARLCVSKRFGAFFMCSNAILITTMAVGYIATHPGVGELPANRCRDGTHPDCETLVVICMAKVALSSVIASVVAFRLKTKVDSIGIKKNLKRTALTYLATNLIFTVAAQMVPIVDGYMFSTTQLMFGYHLMFYFGIEKQVRLAERSQAGHDGNRSKLHQFLQDPQNFALILHHAKSEFNAENLLFWRDVQSSFQTDRHPKHTRKPSNSRTFLLKASDSDVGCRFDFQTENALSIYNKYIVDGSTFQINLPSHITEKIHKDIELLQSGIASTPIDPVKIYLPALKTIEALINNDMLPRFQKTEAGRQAWAEFEMKLRDMSATSSDEISLHLRKGSSIVVSVASNTKTTPPISASGRQAWMGPEPNSREKEAAPVQEAGTPVHSRTGSSNKISIAPL